MHEKADLENPLQFTIDGDCLIPYTQLARLIHYLDTKKITGKTAKRVLAQLFESAVVGNKMSVEEIINQEGLWFKEMSEEEYEELAKSVLDMGIVEEILAGKEGKINFLVGQMMRRDGEGRVDAVRAREVMRNVVEGLRKE